MKPFSVPASRGFLSCMIRICFGTTLVDLRGISEAILGGTFSG